MNGDVNGDVNVNANVVVDVDVDRDGDGDVGVQITCNEYQETGPGEEGGRWEIMSMDGVREKE